MTLTIRLTPEEEARLEAAAESQGVNPAVWAKRLLSEHLPPLTPGNGVRDGNDEDLLAEAVARMTSRTPGQLSEAQSRAAEFIRPGKALTPGQTIFDAVGGKWPGDENDQEVTEALRKLS